MLDFSKAIIMTSTLNPTNNVSYSKLHMNSVRKSGTHLLNKVLHLLDIKGGTSNAHLAPNEHLNELVARCSKLNFNKSQAILKAFDPKDRYIIIYRDPRDVVISHIFFKILPQKRNHNPKVPISRFKNEKLKEHYNISKHISFWLKPQLDKKNFAKYRSGIKNIFTDMKIVSLLKKNPAPNRLLVRFEDLVPEFAGGSSNEIKVEVLKSICSFAEKETSEEKISSVIDNLWGNTWSFRKTDTKKVRQWEKYFEPKHIKLFQKKFNDLLLSLGYESNPNWHKEYLSQKK